MSRRVELRPEAAAEFEAQRRWYEGKRDGLGDDFERCVDEAIAKGVVRQSFTQSFIATLEGCW